jgi:hypothetical protein
MKAHGDQLRSQHNHIAKGARRQLASPAPRTCVCGIAFARAYESGPTKLRFMSASPQSLIQIRAAAMQWR